MRKTVLVVVLAAAFLIVLCGCSHRDETVRKDETVEATGTGPDEGITQAGEDGCIRENYRTYVELYWSSSAREVDPDVCDIVLQNIENFFSERGYRVVQFEQIKGKLMRMLQGKGKNMDDLYSQDELASYKANLELRDLFHNKFVNGKQVLADYADLLIGVTFNSVELTPERILNVRLTINATYFDRGEWVSVAASDETGSIPYIGDNSFIEVSKQVALQICADLEPKVCWKIPDIQKITRAPRDIRVVFKDFTVQEFMQMMQRLQGAGSWEQTGSSTQERAIYLRYEGGKDALASLIYTSLQNAGFNVAAPEYSNDGKMVMFSKLK
ncbi:MAG: hypothetical protein JW759_07425 [Candidatus Coatesbacteria bacterium]|nr:hypothetical protein [Candidatus Coatesbacteria bacterium]